MHRLLNEFMFGYIVNQTTTELVTWKAIVTRQL